MNIKIDDDNIDVKKIMEQIKANVANRPLKDDLLSQSINQNSNTNVNLSQLERHEYVLNRAWNYSADVPITSHRKFTGKIIVMAKKVIRKLLRWYINPIVANQVVFNAEVVRSVNAMIATLKDMESLKQQIDSNKKEIEANKNQIESSISELNKVSELLSGREDFEEIIKSTIDNSVIQDQISLIQQDIEHNKNVLNQDIYARLNNSRQNFDELKSHLFAQHHENQNAYHAIRVATERLRRIERKLKYSHISNEVMPAVIEKHNIKEMDSVESDFDYFLFEEMYRGSREEIKERQKIYLQYFKENDHVLDLGCGRGEFTELLVENNIRVTAVDINDEMILYCKDRGFPIIKSGAIEYLQTLEDNSVNGIFLGQVIEHLEPKQFIALVNTAYKKLKATGVFIAETPNPQCLSVFAQSFYMDITHEKPVHPYTSKFILESAGFSDVQIHYISPNDDQLKLPELKFEGISNPSLDQFNKTISNWNSVIFGYQDYYILGRK